MIIYLRCVMKTNLYLKFTLVYLFFGFMVIFTANTFSMELINRSLDTFIIDSLSTYEIDTTIILSFKNELLMIIYLTLLIVYLLSLGVIFAVHIIIYQPLVHITNAAKEYALGNLEHSIEIRSTDELGYLSASLNYMSKQLKEAKTYQKDFIGNVSHDFRSPLTSIKGYVTALSDGTIPSDNQEKYFNIITSEANRLIALTDNILLLNELSTPKPLYYFQDINILDLIISTVQSLESLCSPKNLRIKLKLCEVSNFDDKVLELIPLNNNSDNQPINRFNSVTTDFKTKECKSSQSIDSNFKIDTTNQLSYLANCDSGKIQQVIYNLLDNSIKFSLDDSVIWIELYENSETFTIHVKDSSVGISPDDLDKIFQRFYKGDISRGNHKNGTGLGLCIASEIINYHGSEIKVRSTLNIGSDFYFDLDKSILT